MKLLQHLQRCDLSVIDFNHFSKQLASCNQQELRILYELISIYLTTKSKIKASITSSELKAKIIIESHSKLKFYQSFWIGRYNFDFFFPQLKSLSRKKMKGLIIEIDGSIHEREFKMKTDEQKREFTKSLSIACTTILNSSITADKKGYVLTQLANYPRLDSRGTQRVLRKVYISTIYEFFKTSRSKLSKGELYAKLTHG